MPGLLSVSQARSTCVAAKRETLASESAAGTRIAREAGKRLALPSSSIRNILHGVFNQYPYKVQSWHGLLPSDTVEREAFVRWALSKIEQDSSWVFNILWTDEAHFSIHYCSIWVTSNPRVYTEKPQHSPKVSVRCGFTCFFIKGPLNFETQFPVNGLKTVAVNAQRYLTLLSKKVVPCLSEKDALSTVRFMQDRATSHTANLLKEF
ncbi:uncharacterized protein NPIL_537431 [Nephila pilipes]|uniref:Transposase n=1 Tax=Nephila pilipes TaxID=299642 RepID=A0A8X6MSR2_NEPPI|nr:uncharacterized protein NPIL_537431 [Nephila pilipes]